MPKSNLKYKKFTRCVKKVKKNSKGKYNPYAVCRVSTKYKGSTRKKRRKK